LKRNLSYTAEETSELKSCFVAQRLCFEGSEEEEEEEEEEACPLLK
jgi:hypothetical protein